MLIKKHFLLCIIATQCLRASPKINLNQFIQPPSLITTKKLTLDQAKDLIIHALTTGDFPRIEGALPALLEKINV